MSIRAKFYYDITSLYKGDWLNNGILYLFSWLAFTLLQNGTHCKIFTSFSYLFSNVFRDWSFSLFVFLVSVFTIKVFAMYLHFYYCFIDFKVFNCIY